MQNLLEGVQYWEMGNVQTFWRSMLSLKERTISSISSTKDTDSFMVLFHNPGNACVFLDIVSWQLWLMALFSPKVGVPLFLETSWFAPYTFVSSCDVAAFGLLAESLWHLDTKDVDTIRQSRWCQLQHSGSFEEIGQHQHQFSVYNLDFTRSFHPPKS